YGVIRLNVQARKEEIEILRLVGATRGFIRGPFLVEGAFQGIAASVLSLVLILVTWIWLSGSAPVRGDFLLQGLVGRFLPLWAPPALGGGGPPVVPAGPLFPARRFYTSLRPPPPRIVRG